MEASIRFAVVGLGHIAQVAVLEAFRKSRRDVTLAALVSSDPEKLETLGERYGVELRVDYEDYPKLLESGKIDAVYIALPNSMHCAYTVAACEHGVHVLCEKPLAVTTAECREMIAAAESHNVKLMTAYRLHFERATLRGLERVRRGAIGEARYFTSSFSMQVSRGNIRLDHGLGGGSLYDIGIYCINAARMLFESEPTRVMAVSVSDSMDTRFTEVPMTEAITLEFPGARLAQIMTSLGAASVSEYRVVGTRGDLLVEPAFEYAAGLRHHLTTSSRHRHFWYPKRDQFSAELAYFARCIRSNEFPEPDGEEGLLDVRVIEACLKSLRTGGPVLLEPYERTKRPRASQEIYRRPVEQIESTINAPPPHN